MSGTLLYQTWQTNLLWPKEPPGKLRIDALNTATPYLADEPSFANDLPPVPEQRRLACHYTKLGRGTYFGQWIPPLPEQTWLAYHYTKLGRWTYFGKWNPQYQSRDTFHTSKHNLADEPTFANGPPSTRAEMPCMPLHKTWQMNLFWLMDPPGPEQRCLEYQYTKLGRWTYFGQWNPQDQSRDALNTSTHNLAEEPTLVNGPPIPE